MRDSIADTELTITVVAETKRKEQARDRKGQTLSDRQKENRREEKREREGESDLNTLPSSMRASVCLFPPAISTIRLEEEEEDEDEDEDKEEEEGEEEEELTA